MTGTDVDVDADLRSTVRSYLAGFVDNAYLNEQEASADGYESARWKQLCELGWTAVNLPARIGGADGTFAQAALIAHECGRAAFASPLLQTMRTAAVLTTLNHERRFDPMLSDIAGGAPAALVAPPDRTVTAKATGDDYVLNGAVTVVEWLAQCHTAVLLLPRADTDEWMCAVLSRERLHDRTLPVTSTDNERSARLDLDGMRLPTPAVVADDVAARDAEYALGRANLLRAAAMVGGCQAVLELTADYARQRIQFGQPIGAFQAARHLLARMAIAVDAADLACAEALAVAGNVETREARDSVMAAVALFVAGRSYVEVALSGAQLHGGIGTTVEHVLHHHYRRAKAMQLRSGKRANRLRELTEALVCRPGATLW